MIQYPHDTIHHDTKYISRLVILPCIPPCRSHQWTGLQFGCKKIPEKKTPEKKIPEKKIQDRNTNFLGSSKLETATYGLTAIDSFLVAE